MSDNDPKKYKGTILPLGNGAVGKTSLGTLLASFAADISGIKKTKNLEFEYAADKIEINGILHKISQQYLIPPGQKESEGEINSRSYERVLSIYRDIIGIPDVILLIFDITNMDSFQDLEFWVEQATRLANDTTELILVGTHLDEACQRTVSGELLTNGIRFIEQAMLIIHPEWKGACQYIEVSNQTKENILELRRLVSTCILKQNGINFFVDEIIPVIFPAIQQVETM